MKVAVSGQSDKNELRAFNKSIKWAPQGVIYESDQRHADNLVEGLGLAPPDSSGASDSGAEEGEERGLCRHRRRRGQGFKQWCAAQCRLEDTPSGPCWATQRGPRSDAPQGRERMTSEDATCKAMAARRNFLGGDHRPDSRFVAKEATRSMATPGAVDMKTIVREAKYLKSVRSRIAQRSLIGRDDGVTHVFRLRLAEAEVYMAVCIITEVAGPMTREGLRRLLPDSAERVGKAQHIATAEV